MSSALHLPTVPSHGPPTNATPLTFPVRLRCPACRDGLTFAPTPTQPFRDGSFGLLTCRCSAYPVLDSIPVLRQGRVDVQDHVTGRTEADGPSSGSLIALLRADRGLDALVAMLTVPPAVPFGLGRKPVLRLPFTRGPWSRAMLARRRREVRAMIGRLEELTAEDWMELVYLRSSESISGELFGYFFLRYGQPRYVASICLLTALPEARGPILDLACGCGHTMYHLAAQDRPRPTVGIDRNFFQLWVGRRYIAPTQNFICSDRVDSLPFDDDAFDASTCTDALHYFDDQQAAMDELRRVARADTVLVDRIGNAQVEPRDAETERDPAGYIALLRGAPWRLADEDSLIADYVAGHGPELATQRSPEEFARTKWLAILSSQDTSLFVDRGGFQSPPHAAGRLSINPAYEFHRDGDEVCLAFRFPSTWYAFENARMLTYTSPGERLDVETARALLAEQSIEQSERYVERFVLLGLPPRYARRPDLGDGFAAGGRQGDRPFRRRRPMSWWRS